MKRNEVLRYPLADTGSESPAMTVRLHRTPSGYWRFDVRYNHQIVEENSHEKKIACIPKELFQGTALSCQVNRRPTVPDARNGCQRNGFPKMNAANGRSNGLNVSLADAGS